MAKELAKHGCMTAIHKHYDVDAWQVFLKENASISHLVAASAGSGDDDFKKLGAILDGDDVKVETICLDVANGYSEHFVDCVRRKYGR